MTGCSRASWYFWRSAFDILCTRMFYLVYLNYLVRSDGYWEAPADNCLSRLQHEIHKVAPNHALGMGPTYHTLSQKFLIIDAKGYRWIRRAEVLLMSTNIYLMSVRWTSKMLMTISVRSDWWLQYILCGFIQKTNVSFSLYSIWEMVVCADLSSQP